MVRAMLMLQATLHGSLETLGMFGKYFYSLCRVQMPRRRRGNENLHFSLLPLFACPWYIGGVYRGNQIAHHTHTGHNSPFPHRTVVAAAAGRADSFRRRRSLRPRERGEIMDSAARQQTTSTTTGAKPAKEIFMGLKTTNHTHRAWSD